MSNENQTIFKIPVTISCEGGTFGSLIDGPEEFDPDGLSLGNVFELLVGKHGGH